MSHRRTDEDVQALKPPQARSRRKLVRKEEVAVVEQAYAMPAPRPKAQVDPIATASTGPEGWVVQVGSSPSKSEAKQALDRAAERGSQVLASAEPFTDAVRESRRDLLPRPLRRLRLAGGGNEGLQRVEEEESRMLRHPAVGIGVISRLCISSKETQS